MATRPLRKAERAEIRPHRPPRLRVVEDESRPPPKRTKSRNSNLPVVVLVVLSVFGVAVLQAWVGQDGLRAASLESDVQREQERQTLLRAQVAQLSSPQRLREEANKLGLVPATDPTYLKVALGGSAASYEGSTPVDLHKRLSPLAP